MTILLLIILGLIAGVFSGLIGIGGGVIIVPILMFLFHFSQKQAQGTTLALLVPPIGILAAFTYYKAGYVDVKAALFIILGFVIGGLLGARYAVHLPSVVLSRAFGVVLVILGLKLLINK